VPANPTDRRSLLKILGAVGATCTYPFQSDELFGQTEAPRPDTNSPHQHSTIPIAHSSPEPQFFNANDFKTISRIADLIIPETDTPGALGAGVPAYIDLVISRNTNQQVVVADGLRWLDSQAAALGASAFTNL
jgi:Gluconate 2-dehydrogenase subunit 3